MVRPTRTQRAEIFAVCIFAGCGNGRLAPELNEGDLVTDEGAVVNGQPQGAAQLVVSSLSTVFDPPGNPTAGQASGFAIDGVRGTTPIRKVFAIVNENDDVPQAPQRRGQLFSVDNGSTFQGYRSGNIPPDFSIKLLSGELIDYHFVPRMVGSTLMVTGRTSADDGSNWSDVFDVPVKLPSLGPSVGRVGNMPVQLADGTVLLPYYIWLAGDSGYRCELLQSQDNGRSFTRRGTIATSPASGINYTEPAVVTVADGTMLAVIRNEGTLLGGLGPLLYTRSRDEGRTWSPVKPLLISFQGKPAATRLGINPRLVLMPNGILALSSGRPNNFVAVSYDGKGNAWVGAETYVNRSAQYWFHGSSGNTGLMWTGSNRLVQIGDNCANSWGCPAKESGWTVDNQNRLWRRVIEVTTPDSGKIDLHSKFRNGALSIQTNMNWTHGIHRRAGPEGALDGSSEYWSGAIAQGAGEFVLTLDREYQLHRVGLLMHPGRKASARVYFSQNGVDWGAPRIDVVDRAQYALEYFGFGPVRARYVKVVLDASTDCQPDLGSTCSMLNEFELYSSINSFENDAVGTPPRGFTEVSGAWVSDYAVQETQRALRIVDDSTTSQSRALYAGPSTSTKTLSFRLKPIRANSGFLFTLLGRNAVGERVHAYHFGVISNGTVSQYRGGKWLPLGPSNLVPLGTVSEIKVVATLSSAAIFVNERLLQTVPLTNSGAVAFDAYLLASSGTAPVGAEYLVDDVVFESP
jgi:hypothetical protein